jgi:hypothetical protein
MLMPTVQTLDQIVSLQRSWWRQYLIEFAKLKQFPPDLNPRDSQTVSDDGDSVH